MQVRDLIEFSRERYFNGAVQTEWVYYPDKAPAIAESYVFHGPKYYGVAQADVQLGQHKLIDTASFSKIIADKLYSEQLVNSFLMTIAGYGAGKSHLAVTLGTLFSGESAVTDTVINNIASADVGIGAYIRDVLFKPNLIIALNGMNNFNLDYEVLKCARLSLQASGIDESPLQRLTKSHAIARQFVQNTFMFCEKRFTELATQLGIHQQRESLRDYLIANVESDQNVLQMVNTVYSEINGDAIRWDRGISGGDILTELSNQLCGEGKPYNKILILFDEFGRYIEYAAANPAIAGEAALQQVFEAVQDANGKVIFVGFIQSDLSAYLSRIEKTANIIRYVGRYEASEKFYLSSNFETILANLIKKKDEATFQKVIGGAVGHYQQFHLKIQEALVRGDRSAYPRSVWSDHNLYQQVILNGCYPLHPMTVWLLSNMSGWMQQRSTIAFAAEMFENTLDAEIDGTWLPYIYPIEIVDSSIYNEMLNSEEKGLVHSQYCMLYRDISLKIGDKLTELEIKVLKAILIVNIGKFSFRDQNDAILMIRNCTDISLDDVRAALCSLEDLHGVTAFDDRTNTYDLIAEASGFNEFKRLFARYRLGVKISIEEADEEVIKYLGLDRDVETSFAQEHNISSMEWSFSRRLVDSYTVNDVFCKSAVATLNKDYSGENARGLLVYVYCHDNVEEEIVRISMLHRIHQLDKQAIILLFLHDVEFHILDALRVRKVLKRFTAEDASRFQKHIVEQNRFQLKKISQRFNQLVGTRQMIGESGLETFSGRINALCTKRFDRIFPSAPPFAFDGFEKKTSVQAKKYLSNICTKLFDSTLMNLQSYQALTQDEKNRVKAVLSVGAKTSWQVFDENCNLLLSEVPQIKAIYEAVDSALPSDKPVNFWHLFGKFTAAPYGMNIYSLTLFFFYYLAQKGRRVLCYYIDERLTASYVGNQIFKQTKIQVNELLKIRMQKNPNADVDMIVMVCDEILSNQYVENCPVLRQKLRDVMAQEGIPSQNELIVAQANMRLDDGDYLSSVIYGRLNEANKLLQDAQQSLVINKFVKIFDHIQCKEGVIEKSSPYEYSESYIESVRLLRNAADKILNDKFQTALSRLSCNITQLSQLKQIYKNAAKMLEKNGYMEYVRAIQNRLETIEEELLIKQKYDNVIVECEKDIAMCIDMESSTYEQCAQLLRKLRGWNLFFSEKADMPKGLFARLSGKIEEEIMLLQVRMDGIVEHCENAIGHVCRTESKAALGQARNSLENLTKLNPPEDLSKRILSVLTDISNAETCMAAMPQNIDGLQQALASFDPSSNTSCCDAILSEYRLALSALEEQEQLWIDSYIVPVENTVADMSTFDCSNWITKTNCLPEFLTQRAVSRYQTALERIRQRLHQCRVEGVVSMFNELTPSEQAECLQLISGGDRI